VIARYLPLSGVQKSGSLVLGYVAPGIIVPGATSLTTMSDDLQDLRTFPRLARLAMRTRFELVIADPGDPAALRAAGEEALEEITRAETLLSAFQDGAELRYLNERAGTSIVPLSPLMMRFLRQCCALVEATDGAFDLAIGALLACWHIQDDGENRSQPTAEVIATAVQAGDLRRQLLLDPSERFVRFAHPQTRLDPGAVGKGWALDRAVGLLRDHGITHALMHGGTSSASAIGHPPNNTSWKIAIRHPTRADQIIAHAHLSDASLSVSGQHGRRVLVGGRHVGHIIDPRTGCPVSDNLLTAVIHPSALVSDALSTALLVLGPSGLDVLSQRFPGIHMLVVYAEGDRVQIAHCGDGFAAT
jgi:FAD:protein FMN transferase